VGPKVGLVAVARRKIPFWDSNHGRSAHSLATVLADLPRL